jgi:hypothetical protein
MTQLSKQQNSVGIIKSLPNTTSKELQLYNAYQTAKKVKDFSTKEDLALMNSLIIRWATYVGIKQPDSIEVNTIANYIRENFPNFNAYDIKECTDLLVADELETDANHYGMLSVIYVSKVLKSYQEHRGRIVFKVREKLQKIEQDTVIPPSDSERIANFKLILKTAKETVSKSEEYYDAGEIVYGFIKHNKLIAMTKELIAEAMAYGERVFHKKAQGNALKDIINGVGFTKLVKEDIVKRHAREYVTDVWLKSTDINGVIKKITIEMIKY